MSSSMVEPPQIKNYELRILVSAGTAQISNWILVLQLYFSSNR
jgi:hypothetical protein